MKDEETVEAKKFFEEYNKEHHPEEYKAHCPHCEPYPRRCPYCGRPYQDYWYPYVTYSATTTYIGSDGNEQTAFSQNR